MNKWENSVKKHTTLGSEYDECLCRTNQGLFVPNRQLSIVIALFLFLFFSFFLTGYFIGKRYQVKQFTEKMQAESFADHVYNSVFNATESENLLSTCAVIESEVDAPSTAINNEVNSIETAQNDSDEKGEEKNYYAQLIGFGTEKAATKFVQKLASKGIETIVKKHMSKTAKGRITHWYQVVTVPFTSKDDLTILVNRIAKEEILKDVSIRSC